MSLFFTRARPDQQRGADNIIPSRLRPGGSNKNVSSDDALRQSAVWAAIRLRADLISTLPVDVFREVGKQQIEVDKPPVLVDTGGPDVQLEEWLYSSQVDLDRVGNAFGTIVEKDSLGKPARIDLVQAKNVTVVSKKGVISYRINGTKYDRDEIWHEKQFTLPGLAVGLSPVANAAWSLGIYQSAQDFALEWFANGAQIPGGVLKNISQTIDNEAADAVKERFKAAVQGRDVFVTGKDWEYNMESAHTADAQFLQAQQASDRDATRYFGVPGDLVDAPVQGSSITYANITERNLQFLIMHLNPALRRREKALTRLVHEPRKVKFNRGGILELDPAASSKVLIAEVAGRVRAPSEARTVLNLPPKFTADQLDEFAVLFPKGTPVPPAQIGATS
ncbi:phage portal protein [Herbiconiux sp. VKM Ac-2851]|uniref:phage portal protein n=1 Tax=Herbiconiux sp. VKM Ac-2851 TaxID=2739025 RepID=UPI0015647F7F|nr:phage portal protein [Herbiconiux sp. VKM Ac-2851]NQX36258.1 phage portal protein [Herbiconiux sp. VKM Ac-2851]